MVYQVKQDFISISFILIAMMIFFYSATWSSAGSMAFDAVLGAILLIGGLVFSFILGYSQVAPVGGKVLIYSLLAFAAIMAMNLVVQLFPTQAATSATVGPISWALFSVLIAISEEQWFRGAITPFMANSMGIMLGSVLSGCVFGIYHFAVYGDNVNALLIVTVAGVMLSYIALESKSITPGMVAHSSNNFIASMGIQLSMLAPWMVFWQYAYIGVLVSVTAFVFIRKYEKKRRNVKLALTKISST